jgi:hypothetical protein
MSRRWLAAQAIAVGVALAVCLSYLRSRGIFNLDSVGADMNAYWEAALRVRAHEPLYPPLSDINASDVFRYPAWFAYAWVPLTFAPKAVITTVWIGSLLAASAFALVPIVRSGSVAGLVLGLLMAPILVEAAWLGNVEPLLVAGLVWGIGTRAEPAAIAFAAATKLTPIAFLAIPLARRDLFGAAMAAGFTGALLLPSLITGNLASYPVEVGGTLSLWSVSPAAWAVAAAGSLVLVVWSARTNRRFVALAASVASLAISPRINLFHAARVVTAYPAHAGRERQPLLKPPLLRLRQVQLAAIDFQLKRRHGVVVPDVVGLAHGSLEAQAHDHDPGKAGLPGL